jgi:hypothetical protein
MRLSKYVLLKQKQPGEPMLSRAVPQHYCRAPAANRGGLDGPRPCGSQFKYFRVRQTATVRNKTISYAWSFVYNIKQYIRIVFIYGARII